MTTRSTGSAGLRPHIQQNITISSSITASIQSISGLQAAQFAAATPAALPQQIVYGDRTLIPDHPGFAATPTRMISTASQVSAVRSAATNTAIAFGLDPVKAADTASIILGSLQQKTLIVQPTVTITEVIIPS